MSMGKFRDLAGQVFGRLTVSSTFERRPERPGGQNRTFWLCVCTCGESKFITSGNVVTGGTTSCGCRRREFPNYRTHGMSGSTEHQTWKNIIKCCHNPNTNRFEDYGGRGIVVCERGRLSFEAFKDFAASVSNGRLSFRFRPSLGRRLAQNPPQTTNHETNREHRLLYTLRSAGQASDIALVTAARRASAVALSCSGNMSRLPVLS